MSRVSRYCGCSKILEAMQFVVVMKAVVKTSVKGMWDLASEMYLLSMQVRCSLCLLSMKVGCRDNVQVVGAML